MEPKINSVALLILIILGVAVGNLASSWINARYIEAKVEKTPAEVSKAFSKNLENTQQDIKKLAEPLKNNNIENQGQFSEQRKLDNNGIRLAKTCSEWKAAHKDMNTQSSERGMNKHCEQYQIYINTGALPLSW